MRARILILTPGPLLQKKSSFKMTHEPQPSLQWYLQLPRHRPKKRCTDKLDLRDCCTYTQGAITQTSDITNEIMRLCQRSPQAWTSEENTLSEVSNRGRQDSRWCPWRAKSNKRDTEEIICIIKRDCDSNTNIPKKKKKERESSKDELGGCDYCIHRNLYL